MARLRSQETAPASPSAWSTDSSPASRGSKKHRDPRPARTRIKRHSSKEGKDDYKDEEWKDDYEDEEGKDDWEDEEEQATSTQGTMRPNFVEDKIEAAIPSANYTAHVSTNDSTTLSKQRQRNRHRDDSTWESTQGGSWLQDFYGDLGLMYRVLYFFLKWPLLICIIWIALTHAYLAGVNHLSQTVEPYCEMWIVGKLIPFCPAPTTTKEGSADNATATITSLQDEIGGVVDSVGQNHELARLMTRHEAALRDLNIRVGASNLQYKQQLGRELDSLIRFTDEAAWATSDFTARANKVGDIIIATNEYTVKKLGAIEDRENQALSLQQVAVNIVNPYGMFWPTGHLLTGERLKESFLVLTSQMVTRLDPLLADTVELYGLFNNIQLTLLRIKELVGDEAKDTPELSVLSALWKKLARPDEYAEHKSHGELLEHLIIFYKDMAERVTEVRAGLKRVNSELNVFRDEYSSVRLVLRDFPLSTIMSRLQGSTERLLAGRRALEEIESRERRRKLIGNAKVRGH